MEPTDVFAANTLAKESAVVIEVDNAVVTQSAVVNNSIGRAHGTTYVAIAGLESACSPIISIIPFTSGLFL